MATVGEYITAAENYVVGLFHSTAGNPNVSGTLLATPQAIDQLVNTAAPDTNQILAAGKPTTVNYLMYGAIALIAIVALKGKK